MRYRLETEHYLWDHLLAPGTEIGEGTNFQLPENFRPSASMTPLDKEAADVVVEMKRNRPYWGRPDAALERIVTGDMHPGDNHPVTTTRPHQPIIPPPLEHLMRPNTMRPGDRENDIADLLTPLAKAELGKREEERAKKDAEDAAKANEAAETISKAAEAKKPTPPRPPGQASPPKTLDKLPASPEKE